CALILICFFFCFFFSSRRRHTRSDRDWSSDVCSSDLDEVVAREVAHPGPSDEGPLERRAAQVEVAVLQPLLLSGLDGVLDGEGRSEERRVGKECGWRWSRGQ